MYRVVAQILITVFTLSVASAQRDAVIQIRQAESLSFDGTKNILKGNVICEHAGALLHCDTAYIYREQNRMEATGHILITKGDSIRVTGDNLVYDGRSRLAILRDNVRCVEKDMVLTTNLLTFDVRHSVANYVNGGTIVNRQNTLVSRNGHYYSATKEATFHYDVVLTNPEYKMNCDTLRYKIAGKTAYFLGPSVIYSKKDYIYCENGWYDTDRDRSAFSRNALLITDQQKLKGDSLVYDRKSGIGRAFRNVTLTDTSHKSLIYGDYAEYNQKSSEALITKRPLYARIFDRDTLFVAADTLYHHDVDSTNNILLAYHHVRVFKPDMQAVADSASFSSRDSLLTLFRDPLLWTSKSQATARLIKVNVADRQVSGFELDGRAFLIQDADTIRHARYNQLSGRNIRGFIVNDTVRKMIVTGNAEMLYYPKNKDRVTGLNKTVCSEISVWMPRGEMERVTLSPKTTGQVDPLHVVDPASTKLKGFNWQEARRPRSRFQLHAQKK